MMNLLRGETIRINIPATRQRLPMIERSIHPGSAPMLPAQPITDLIPRRFSCRVYQPRPIAPHICQHLRTLLADFKCGPFGAAARFKLVAATEREHRELHGLGTYGFIKGATGFVVGAIGPGEKNLEDYGYLMERIILEATGLGLGTCWLGGSFTQSSFARKIGLREEEIMPAVTSIGYLSDEDPAHKARLRRRRSLGRRYPWECLFFYGGFGVPLSPEEAGAYATALEMVRLGPSASNKQPWRVVKEGEAWHFYLQRTPGYGRGSLVFRILRLADLQRVDMGIAMCHFELAADELGLPGTWTIRTPGLVQPEAQIEYIASWENRP